MTVCEPTTLAAISAITTIAGGVYGAQAQRQAGKYEAEVAEQNAKIAGIQAEQARQTGNIEEERQRMRVRQMIGQQRAAFAANNVEVSGSALDVLGDTAGFGFADATQIRSNALREAWGFNVQQQNEVGRARAARIGGRNAAIGTLLTTGAQATGMWAQSGGGNPFRRSGASSAGPYRSGYRYPGG